MEAKPRTIPVFSSGRDLAAAVALAGSLSVGAGGLGYSQGSESVELLGYRLGRIEERLDDIAKQSDDRWTRTDHDRWADRELAPQIEALEARIERLENQ